MPALPAGARLHHPQAQDHGLESRLDNELIEACRSAIEGGTPIRLERTVRNVNRTVGAMLSGEIARRYGHRGLAPDTIRIEFSGVAGQSFGAWLAHGVTLDQIGRAHV